MSKQGRNSVVLASILAGIALSVAVLYGYMLTKKIEAGAESLGKPVQKAVFDASLHEAFLFPEARQINDFELVDDRGQLFNLNRFRKHWTLVYFGFTHCPDICPPALADMKRVFDAVPKPDEAYSQPLQFVFATVDPERDSPEVLKNYLAGFNPNFIGISGSRESLSALASTLNVHMETSGATQVAAEPDAGAHEGHHMPEASTISHSGNLVLIDPEGRYAGFFKPPFRSENVHAVLSYIALN